MTTAAGTGERDSEGQQGRPRAHVTPFLGRHSLLQQCLEAIRSETLVTLYGAGGVGKTRLLEELARQIAAESGRRESVVMVYLETFSADDDHHQLAATILGAMGLLDNDAGPSVARLVTCLQARPVVLMLDNCEDLVGRDFDGPVPRLLRSLIATFDDDAGPSMLRIVCTSRERVGVQGEQRIRIPGLTLGSHPDPAACGEMYEALEFLIDRARRVNINTAISPNDPNAHRLCAALEGLPLALELAAGRTDTFSLAKILTDIEAQKALPMLVGGDSDRPEHRTMHATIQSSFTNLDPAAQRVATLMAVFPDGAELDGVQTVCVRMGVAKHQIEQLLSELVQRSLLRAVTFTLTTDISDGTDEIGAAEDVRLYRLAPLVREFCLTVLRQAGEYEAAQMTHAEYVVELHQAGAQWWFGPREHHWMQRLGLYGSSSRAATRTLLATKEPGRIEQAQDMEMASASSRWRIFGGQLQEMRRMQAACIERHPQEPTERLVVLLAISAWVAMIQGQPANARPLLDQAEAAARVVGCEQNAVLLHAQVTWSWMSDPESRWTPEDFDMVVLPRLHQVEQAFRELGPGDHHMAVMFTGIGTAFCASPDVALTQSRRVLDDARTAGAVWAISWGYWTCAVAVIQHGEIADALKLAYAGLRIQRELGELWGLAWTVWLIFVILVRAGEYALAGQVFGGAQEQLKLTSADVSGLVAHLRLQRTAVDKAAWELGEDWATQVAIGRGFSREKLLKTIDHAVALLGQDERPGMFAAARLTTREREIAEMVVGGLKNRQIADRLTLSPRTVETHVGRILAKVGVSNRAALIDAAGERGYGSSSTGTSAQP